MVVTGFFVLCISWVFNGDCVNEHVFKLVLANSMEESGTKTMSYIVLFVFVKIIVQRVSNYPLAALLGKMALVFAQRSKNCI